MALKPKILFVSHSAGRNGATILLLNLLRWMKARDEYEFEILVNGRGELLEEFRALAPTRVWPNLAFLLASMPGSWRRSLAPRLEAELLKGLVRGQQYDLIHVNTVAMWQHLPALEKRSSSVLWHVHELDYAVRLTTGEDGWKRSAALARRFVVVSQSVRDFLVTKLHVPAEKVDVVHGFVPPMKLSREEQSQKRCETRQALGWEQDCFVVGGCGSLGWRKGSDLFLQMANTIRRRGHREIRYLWVGGGTRDQEALEFDHDVRVMGLEGCCRRIPSTADVVPYYSAMDVFALSSREDPFPLVMLEAGGAGLPVVCFADSGGGPEFVDGDAGLIAPYLNVEAFAAHLITLSGNEELRRRLGAEAARRVRTIYTAEMQAPKLLQSIERCLRRD